MKRSSKEPLPKQRRGIRIFVSNEISAMNGSVYINFMQYFKDECYLKAFIKDLRDNDINYDVLYAEDTKYPNLIDLWGLLGRSL